VLVCVWLRCSALNSAGLAGRYSVKRPKFRVTQSPAAAAASHCGIASDVQPRVDRRQIILVMTLSLYDRFIYIEREPVPWIDVSDDDEQTTCVHPSVAHVSHAISPC
jgi:hypothetical protein